MDKRDNEYRKELIEIKKKRAENMDPGSERILNPEPPPPPLTFSGKIKHYWFYYKFYLLAFAVVAIVTAVCIKSCVDRVNPDISVILLTENTILDDDLTKFETALGKYTEDYNNNGRVDVSVISITIGSQDTQYNYTMQQKLMAEIAAGDSFIYVSDDKGFDRFIEIDALGDIKSLSANTVKDGKAVSVNTKDILGDTEIGTLPESLYFSIRVYSEKDAAKENKKAKQINNSIETFSAIINSSPVSVGQITSSK